MNGATIVAMVIGAFFLIGIAVGVVTVIAASALRGDADRAKRELAKRAEAENDARWTGGGPGVAGWTGTAPAGWEEPPVPGEGDGPPRWPGGFNGLATRGG